MLDDYAKNSIATTRKNLRLRNGVAIGIVSIIESGTQASDPFKRATYKYESVNWVSGEAGWISESERRFLQGGIAQDADARIVIDLSEKDNIKVKNTHLRYLGTDLDIQSYEEVTDTKEIVIMARRIK